MSENVRKLTEAPPILKTIYRTNDDEAVEKWEDLPFSSCLGKKLGGIMCIKEPRCDARWWCTAPNSTPYVLRPNRGPP